MSERLFLTDHDGVLTDSQREMGEYTQIVIDHNAQTLGISVEESEKLLNAAKAKIVNRPGKYGWKWGPDKLIVAPATSDHFQFNQTATDLVLTRLASSSKTIAKKLEEIGGNEKYIINLYLTCSPKLGVFYREDARQFLLELAKMKKPEDWAVVTNSDPVKVSAKLAKLNLNLDFELPVVGFAKKFEVNRDWTALLPKGPYKDFPGYPKRGIELQRETFYKTLKELAGERIKSMVFVEDVAEFVAWIDYLSENNPEWSEAKTALVFTPNTPSWEKKRYTVTTKNRFGSESLMEILDWATK